MEKGSGREKRGDEELQVHIAIPPALSAQL
jgi:hypothetical protein